ncbi:hypothetical protein FA13DRAFT_1105372, partial [Coprinellus micaceus]
MFLGYVSLRRLEGIRIAVGRQAQAEPREWVDRQTDLVAGFFDGRMGQRYRLRDHAETHLAADRGSLRALLLRSHLYSPFFFSFLHFFAHTLRSFTRSRILQDGLCPGGCLYRHNKVLPQAKAPPRRPAHAHDDDRFNDAVSGDYEPYPHPPFHPFANANDFDHWPPPHTQTVSQIVHPETRELSLTCASPSQHIPDPTATASSSASTVLASSSINLAQGTATRAHPRPPATARAKQGEYVPSHRQQLQQPQLAIVTQPSAAAQPVLFDFDMDAEWHQTGAQFEAQQQQQQFALNLSLNNPSLPLRLLFFALANSGPAASHTGHP